MNLFSGDSEVTFLRDMVKTLQETIREKDRLLAEMAQPLINARLAHAERVIGRRPEKQDQGQPPIRASAGALRNRREDRPGPHEIASHLSVEQREAIIAKTQAEIEATFQQG